MNQSSQSKKPLPTELQLLQGFLWLHLLLMLTQTWAFFDYDLMARNRLQEPRFMAEEAVVQSNRAKCLTGTIVIVPLSVLSLYGISQRKFFGALGTGMVLATAMYWSVEFLSSRYTYSSADIRHVDLQGGDFGICAFFFLFSCWGSWKLCHSPVVAEWARQDISAHDGRWGCHEKES